MSAPSTSEVLHRVDGLLDAAAPPELRSRVANAVRGLDAAQLGDVHGVLDEVMDLEERTVRNVLGRDGEVVPVHHFTKCRAEDAEASWDFRAARPPVRAIRDALMSGLLGAEGVRVDGVQRLAHAERSGKRFLFISNHESVFDLAVLSHALMTSGLEALSRRLTFFVNPKIFNLPFVNFFICKSIGLIKMPQSPRIAANESVMEPDEIERRAAHGFGVAGERLSEGDSLAIYPEGLRSEGELHRFARAYLDLLRPAALELRGIASDDVLLVPWAHRGVRTLEDAAAAAEVELTLGDPIEPERFFDVVGSHSPGVAAHLAGYLVARLLPEDQRGLYGEAPETYLDHAHYRLRIKPHTLADIEVARQLPEPEAWLG